MADQYLINENQLEIAWEKTKNQKIQSEMKDKIVIEIFGLNPIKDLTQFNVLFERIDKQILDQTIDMIGLKFLQQENQD